MTGRKRVIVIVWSKGASVSPALTREKREVQRNSKKGVSALKFHIL